MSTQVMSVKVPKDTKVRFRVKAAQQDRTMSDYLRELVEREVEGNGQVG